MNSFAFFVILINFHFNSARNYKTVLKLDQQPLAKYTFNNYIRYKKSIVKNWDVQQRDNVWEHSGLLEGDVMTSKNGNTLRSPMPILHWENGIIPFDITKNHFNREEITLILKAMKAIHDSTCVRFKPYKKYVDTNWLKIQSNETGCWGYIGMQGKGQIINLQSPICIKHGVIVHELMHSLGFFHQHTHVDRDRYIKIHWENIKSFAKKYFRINRYVKNFGVGYDYASIMHYSSKAFSKNGESTITPLKPNTEIGQRKGLSTKDILKINAMYRNNCAKNEFLRIVSGGEIVTLIRFYDLGIDILNK